ncbi:hypothetical protein B0H14DRAFT_3784775 [Mycena olivaceomarginata]|nr:hypothetical protein B0H14DRAFT_3784775 [Mycena olivaceomarginata]
MGNGNGLMLLFFLLPLPALLQVVDALLNVTVDNLSPLITYQGEWEPASSHVSDYDWAGNHALSSDEEASATFIFTGVAVYYLSPRWPYDVSTRLSLDGGQSVLSSVAWSATGLTNTSHTLVATYGNMIIVDAFIYTKDNASTPISSSASASSTTSSASSSLSASASMAASSAGATTIPSKKALTIGLGTAFALAVLIAGLLLAFALYQRRRFVRARSARPRDATGISDWASYLRGPRRLRRRLHRPRARARDLRGVVPAALPPSSSGRSDPWAPNDDLEYKHYDAAAAQHAQVPSSASSMGRTVSSAGVGRNASTVGRSVSAVSSAPGRRARGAGLPTGAMPPAVPGPYVDRAPPEDEDAEDDDDDDDADRAGAPLRRAPSAGILFRRAPDGRRRRRLPRGVERVPHIVAARVFRATVAGRPIW